MISVRHLNYLKLVEDKKIIIIRGLYGITYGTLTGKMSGCCMSEYWCDNSEDGTEFHDTIKLKAFLWYTGS